MVFNNMKLLFQNSLGEERVVAEVNSYTEATEEINKFLNEHNFISYYTRVWEENSRLKFDVGSWSEFFFLEDYCLEDMYNEQEESEED